MNSRSDPCKLKIAVLMTCHNRCVQTRRCLEGLRSQVVDADVDVFLVDDGSKDGTAEMVVGIDMNIKVITGSGSLYWNGGMNLAWKTAIESGNRYTHFLWLNDDVILRPDAIRELASDYWAIVAQKCTRAVIVAGATCSSSSEEITYGAQVCLEARRPFRFRIAKPSGAPMPCDTFSGNCVLVAAEAFSALGCLNKAFVHIYGDLDYGLRAKAHGVPVYSSSRVCGTCERNSQSGRSFEIGLGILTRLRRRLQEDASIHGRDWRAFLRLHVQATPVRIAYILSPYIRILLRRYPE